jgi:hypothetical protein
MLRAIADTARGAKGIRCRLNVHEPGRMKGIGVWDYSDDNIRDGRK